MRGFDVGAGADAFAVLGEASQLRAESTISAAMRGCWDSWMAVNQALATAAAIDWRANW